MGNDDSDVGLVQLGNWAIGRSALEEPGAGWEETVAGRFPEEGLLPPRAREDFPLKGWRHLHSSNTPWAIEVLILGAPSELHPGRWVLVQLSRDANGWQFAMPGSYLPVPVQEVRRQGLRLEWAKPEFIMGAGSEPEITVVLTNDSAGRWIPTEGDHCHVQGIIFDDQGARIGNGWYAHKQAAQLPAVDPGQRAVLPAFRNNPELVGLPGGRYQIMATLTALDLRTATRGSLTVL